MYFQELSDYDSLSEQQQRRVARKLCADEIRVVARLVNIRPIDRLDDAVEMLEIVAEIGLVVFVEDQPGLNDALKNIICFVPSQPIRKRGSANTPKQSRPAVEPLASAVCGEERRFEGNPCGRETAGLLQRRKIGAPGIVHIGGRRRIGSSSRRRGLLEDSQAAYRVGSDWEAIRVRLAGVSISRLSELTGIGEPRLREDRQGVRRPSATRQVWISAALRRSSEISDPLLISGRAGAIGLEIPIFVVQNGSSSRRTPWPDDDDAPDS